jgi:hypothetical protein
MSTYITAERLLQFAGWSLCLVGFVLTVYYSDTDLLKTGGKQDARS